MQKKDYIDIFLSDPNGKGLRNSLEKIAKEMQNVDNVFTMFAEPADYCLYQLLSENDQSLRIPNVIHEDDKPENVNIILMAVIDWRFAFCVWKNVQAEYECPVQLTAVMSYCNKLSVQEILKNEETREVSEFFKVLKIQDVVSYGKSNIYSNISWINTQKRVLLALCHERYKGRIHTDVIELSKEQMLDLQKRTGGTRNWSYLGIANLIPDLIFGRQPYDREMQYGVFYLKDQFIEKIFDDRITLFVKYSWNDRREFLCEFTPVVEIGALATSDVANIFDTLFPKLRKKGMTTIKKYKFIEHFFECYTAVVFRYYAECNNVKISWKIPECMTTEDDYFSKLLQEDNLFFINNIRKIKRITNIQKRENNYFTDKDLLNSRIFKLPTGKIEYLYLHFDLIILNKYRRGEECFVSIEKWRRFVSDYLIQKSGEEVNKILYGVLLVEVTMMERGKMLETYFVRDGIVWHGFVPGENMEVLNP